MQILLDMDGVLCDYRGAFAERFAGADCASKEQYHSLKHQLIGTDFFRNIPVFDNVQPLIHSIFKMFGGYSICSAPMLEDEVNSAQHKMAWIKQHLPVQPDKVIFTQDKWMYAENDVILVDDLQRNIVPFDEAGGIAVHWVNDGSGAALQSLLAQLQLYVYYSIDDALQNC